MYKINKAEFIIPWDVDETLITFDEIPGVVPINLCNGNFSQLAYPIEIEIKRLREAKVRGHYVRVHSAGGQEWAERVVIALGLQEFVDDIETKPKFYHDDLPADVWMHRFYEGPKK